MSMVDLTIDSSSLSNLTVYGTSVSTSIFDEISGAYDFSNKLFKVGDYVKIVDPDFNLSCKIGKIQFISDYTYGIKLLDGVRLRTTDSNNLIMATRAEVREAKRNFEYNKSCGGPKDMPYYNLYNRYNKYKPVRIIYNDPATIVFWKDGTKTVVKKAKGEKFNKYNAFCAALAKKIFENNSQVNKVVASGVDQTAKKGKNKLCKNK